MINLAAPRSLLLSATNLFVAWYLMLSPPAQATDPHELLLSYPLLIWNYEIL